MAAVENVVDDSDLFMHTTAGWEVVERFEIDVPMSLTKELRDPNNLYSPIVCHDTVLGKTSLFRIRKTENKYIDELNLSMRAADERATTAREEVAILSLEVTALKKKLSEQEATVAHLKLEDNRLRTNIDSLASTKRALETDIGKIREHVGKKMMDEILCVAVSK